MCHTKQMRVMTPPFQYAIFQVDEIKQNKLYFECETVIIWFCHSTNIFPYSVCLSDLLIPYLVSWIWKYSGRNQFLHDFSTNGNNSVFFFWKTIAMRSDWKIDELLTLGRLTTSSTTFFLCLIFTAFPFVLFSIVPFSSFFGNSGRAMNDQANHFLLRWRTPGQS